MRCAAKDVAAEPTIQRNDERRRKAPFRGSGVGFALQARAGDGCRIVATDRHQGSSKGTM